MNVKQLTHLVEQAETHRKIVGAYQGSYALGVTDNPPAFVLRVEPDDISSFPDKVNIQGVEVPVIVQGRFRPPVPLKRRG